MIVKIQDMQGSSLIKRKQRGKRGFIIFQDAILIYVIVRKVAMRLLYSYIYLSWLAVLSFFQDSKAFYV